MKQHDLRDFYHYLQDGDLLNGNLTLSDAEICGNIYSLGCLEGCL